MSRLIYNLLFPFVFLALLPGWLLRMARRGGYRRNFLQRFGYYAPEVLARYRESRPVWVHAVSVGEVLIALKLIAAMRRDDPDLRVVLSTTTSTGYALAREKAGGEYEVVYYPLDLPWVVRRVFAQWKPCEVVLVEAEVWPNFTAEARRRGIPVTLVNARLSGRSERRYRRIRWLVRPVFAQLDLACVQEEGDCARWEGVGIRREVIAVCGSIKFDDADAAGTPDAAKIEAIACAVFPGEGNLVLIGGSTHEGEEVLLARVYVNLRKEFPTLKLVLVPRHFERSGGVVAKLETLGLRLLRRSRWTAEAGEADIFLVDTTGELRAWYARADVAFVGKSLLAEGGQNPAEPVMAGAATVFGPNMQNFQPLATQLLTRGGALEVGNERDLEEKVRELLRSPEKRAAMVEAGRQVLAAHRGATQRTVKLLRELREKATS